MKYYECHITLKCNPEELNLVEETVEHLGWKYSRIDGDPVMGKGVKCYATMHYNAKLSEEEVLTNLLTASAKLQKFGIEVTRNKIELVIYDDRSSKVWI